MLLVFLIACTGGNRKYDPIALVHILDENYCVELIVDDDEILVFPHEGKHEILCMLVAEPAHSDEKIGYFLFCDNVDFAKKMEKHIEETVGMNEKAYGDIVRFAVERSGDLVFFGCEDVWEKVQEE